MDNYYKAYDKRYSQVHSNNMLWASRENTNEVIKFLDKYKCSKDDYILELGFGEGRDSIYLLDNNYKVLGLDYSISAINKCNELSNNKYRDYFKQFDLMTEKIDRKFKYIYSIAVLHMFILDGHRDLFYKFIYEHLSDGGYCLICVLGNGENEYMTDITKAFDDSKRVVMNNDTVLDIATTSCRVINFSNLEKEIERNKLKIKEKFISNNVPEFSSSMCVVVSK